MQGGEIFVPKIPSMRIVDLIEAIAPGCRTEEVGIRPGEKLHELMIPSDDARRTLEFDRHFVVTPDFEFWNPTHYTDGKPVSDRFEYSSDRNTEWLSVERMREVMVELGFERPALDASENGAGGKAPRLTAR
jgi:UDP-N-acetylglucosamine 4,6-dehydratase